MKTEKDALRPLEWLKIDMDHVSAVLEYKYGNQFLQMLKTTARRRGVVETCDMPELVADRVIVEIDGGFIPACMLQSLQASNKFVSCGRNGGLTTQSRKSLISEATLEATLEPAIKPPFKLVRGEEENENENEERKQSPPQAAPGKPGGEIGYSSDFLKFWESYPEKKSKGQAWSAWQKIKKPRPELSEMIAVIEASKLTPKWRGGFTPHPATWLNARGWEDDPTPQRITMTGGSPSDDYSSIAQKL